MRMSVTSAVRGKPSEWVTISATSSGCISKSGWYARPSFSKSFAMRGSSVGRFDGLHESEKTFGACAVGLGGAFQEAVRRVREHVGGCDLHGVPAFARDNRCAYA